MTLEGMHTQHFLLDVVVQEDKLPDDLLAAADELHNSLASLADDQLPEWLFSVDGVDVT